MWQLVLNLLIRYANRCDDNKWLLRCWNCGVVSPCSCPLLPQDNLKEEEKLKKELRLRMAYAGFLLETITAMAVKGKSGYAHTVASLATVAHRKSSLCFRSRHTKRREQSGV